MMDEVADRSTEVDMVAPRMIVNVEVIVEREGRYLLIVRSDDEEYGAGWLTLPGGKLEPDENSLRALEVTAQRELQEEVGLDVALEDIRYVESHLFAVEAVPVLDVVMMTRAARGEPSAVDPAEVAGVAWMTADEIAAHPDVPAWTRASVAMAITELIT
jgi:ADP-ribose pyrophosphatase YjhB (NUDIX family)